MEIKEQNPQGKDMDEEINDVEIDDEEIDDEEYMEDENVDNEEDIVEMEKITNQFPNDSLRKKAIKNANFKAKVIQIKTKDLKKMAKMNQPPPPEKINAIKLIVFIVGLIVLFKVFLKLVV